MIVRGDLDGYDRTMSRVITTSAYTNQADIRRTAAFRQALVSPDTYATALLIIAADEYGDEFLEWHPETVRMQLEEDFEIEMPPASVDRLSGSTIRCWLTATCTGRPFNVIRRGTTAMKPMIPPVSS